MASQSIADTRPASPQRPRLFDRVRDALRARHYSRRTEEAYIAWIRRYILFHGKRHPAEMGAAEITQFLTSLAVQRKVAAATQNQALSALSGVPRLMALLLYGAGLRVLECARLRVKDVDFASNQIVVRAGKGDRDRVTMLPATVTAIDLPRRARVVACVSEAVPHPSLRAAWPT